MKRLSSRAVMVSCMLVILVPVSVSSQIISSNAFLKGNYVQVGINNCGAYGSNVAPPVGYAYDVYSGLGFTADGDGDGWGTGYPSYCGDYFVPGSPVEGWGIEIAGSTWFNTDQYCSPYSIPGSITGYTYTGGVYSATWEGDVIYGSTNLHITQTTTLPEDKKYFITKIYICNNAATAANDIYYMRNVDPDNDEPWSYDFTTYNVIVDNPPGVTQSLVTSEGLSYGCYLGLGARDVNSRVSYGNFFTNAATPQDVYMGTWGYYNSGSMTGDIANSIAFKIQTIAAGECKCISFAYILNATDLAEALDATTATSFMVDGVACASSDTVIVTAGSPVTLDIMGYAGYTWDWSPGTYLSGTTGASVTATPGTTITYDVYGTGSLCGNVTGTITLIVSGPLPVQLNYFGASCAENQVDLKWSTLSEMNSDHFIIERSADGIVFDAIGTIPAAGFSNESIDYYFTDAQPFAEKNYYRLKQYDLNGDYTCSGIVSETCTDILNDLSILSASVYQNGLNITVGLPNDGDYGVELYDLSGREIFYRSISMNSGVHNMQIPLDAEMAEQYYISVLTCQKTGRQVSWKTLALN